MRARLAVLLMMLLLPVIAVPPVFASPADQYSGPYFGADNFPPGCIRDMSADNPDNICHHMRTGLNALDSPKVDVLVLVPVSPTAERDMRIMRQSIEMWEGGIDYLAGEMGLDWLADGMDFHITVDDVDPEGDGGEFTTYPIVDPEIVVIATNPVGGVGIGIDPVDFFSDETDLCHGVTNPLDFEQWEALPGFDSHHEERSGTYVEDCAGAGGNVCFAINGAIDPAPETIDFFGLFDLVSHEVGHCLTIGHVGDGAEGVWGVLPPNDIMAYSADPPGLTKCVSTLDVEGIAARMSSYLDVDGDGEVTAADRLLVNDQVGQGGNPFQIQHPDDHLYASGTGSPLDCPQPDVGLVPGERTDWTPAPVDSTSPVLTVTSPDDGAVSEDGTFTVAGSVEHVELATEEQPTSPTGTHDDADDDASTPITEILSLDVAATADTVEATIALAELWPSTDVVSPTSYSVVIDGRRFDSFVRYPVDANPKTWDNSAAAYLPDGTSTWDLEAKTVTFTIPRTYLSAAGIEAPFFVRSQANLGFLATSVADDSAPDGQQTVGISGGRIVDPAVPTGATHLSATGAEHTDTFTTDDSSFGVTQELGLEPRHSYPLEVAEPSTVEVTLTWTDEVGGSDLDLYVTGDADSGSQGATVETTERVVLTDVSGTLSLEVDPYLVTGPVDGATYTLTAVVTPTETTTDAPDRDGDGVPDEDDRCPDDAGDGADGCPTAATEHVRVFLGDLLLGSEAVDTANGADTFSISVDVPEGTHDLRIEWEDEGDVLASTVRTVTSSDGGGDDGEVADDRDGDGVTDGSDNCRGRANPDQSDQDGDGTGDACDRDRDGDGHSNEKEEAHDTDPDDPGSSPGKDR